MIAWSIAAGTFLASAFAFDWAGHLSYAILCDVAGGLCAYLAYRAREVSK